MWIVYWRIYKNINVCIIGRKRHVLVYKSSEKPMSRAAPVQSKQNRTHEFQTKLLETIMSELVSAHFNKS